MNHPVRKLFNKLKKPNDETNKQQQQQQSQQNKQGGGPAVVADSAKENSNNDPKREQQIDLSVLTGGHKGQERSMKSTWSMHFESSGENKASKDFKLSFCFLKNKTQTGSGLWLKSRKLSYSRF